MEIYTKFSNFLALAAILSKSCKVGLILSATICYKGAVKSRLAAEWMMKLTFCVKNWINWGVKPKFSELRSPSTITNFCFNKFGSTSLKSSQSNISFWNLCWAVSYFLALTKMYILSTYE